MKREDAKLGMTVVFGRENGEQTEGVIIKINFKTAKVRTTEARGHRDAGRPWNVAWSLCHPCNTINTTATVVNTPVALPKPKLKFNEFDTVKNTILDAILQLYCNLSPENISCDGEAPMSVVRQRSMQYNTQLKHLFNALGQNVSETEIYEWDRERREQKKLQKVV